MSSSPPTPTRRDGAVVAGLLVVLAVITAAIAAPALAPTTATPSAAPVAPRGTPGPVPAARMIREGIVGAPDTINPLLARTRADDDLVALVFSGLVRLGPGQSLEPDLAAEWSASEDGRTWTFTLREDARWHDGEPVTAADVVFTVGLMRDPAWTGQGAPSWRDVSARALDERTVQFELGTPIGGFLQAATQRILPAHLLEGIAIERLARHPFNRQPVGSGPYRLESLDESHATLIRVDRPARLDETPAPGASASALGAIPAGLELWFYEHAEALAAAYEAGELDAAHGLPAAEARRLAATADSRLLRYPSSTLTAVLFNLRLDQPALRDARVRMALLRGTDRASAVDAAWEGQAQVADAPIPRVSWAFDGMASPSIGYDRLAGTRGLLDAGWKAADGEWTAPKASEPFELELLSADIATNRGAFLASASIVADWQRMALDVVHRPLPSDLLVERLRSGDFAAAVVDINVGLDPDLYPLLASSQATSHGLNLSGLVDPDLDKLLAAARAPGSEADRRAAYRALQVRLAERQYLLPIAFRDELTVLRAAVQGREIREVGGPGDRFWDVLSWRLADDR